MSKKTPVKTTLYIDPDDYRRVKLIARAEGRTAAALVREAVSEYAARRSTTVRPSSIGAWRSGEARLSERAEELLDGMGDE